LFRRERDVRTSAILLLVFLLVFLLIDLCFYVKEPVNGSALVTALGEVSVVGGHSYRIVAYLLPFAATVRAFIVIFVILFSIIHVFTLFIIFLLIVFLFVPSTLLVVFAAGVAGRSLWVSLLSIVAWTRK